jgi:hypothetical protein
MSMNQGSTKLNIMYSCMINDKFNCFLSKISLQARMWLCGAEVISTKQYPQNYNGVSGIM